MNIFCLDKDPQKCAWYHSDIHIPKMVLESVQLLFNGYYESELLVHQNFNSGYLSEEQWLSDTHRTLSDHGCPKWYKPSHWNHPCSRWARRGIENWRWLRFLAYYLEGEYYQRFGKEHACKPIIDWMMENEPQLPKKGFITKRPQSMPEHLQIKGKTVMAYREYYRQYKWDIAKYQRGRESPFFMLPF